MKPLLGACLLAVALTASAAPWQNSLSPDLPGPFAEVRPFQANYRFGWSDIEAAEATATIRYEGNDVFLEGRALTNGLARTLWQLDVEHLARTQRDGFKTIETTQTETYRSRTIFTHMLAKPDGLWRLRDTRDPAAPAKWKRVNISPLRDLFAGMLFIRSQNLKPGDEIQTIIYPGDSPFLVRINALGTETIRIADTPRDALKLEIHLQRINLKKGSTLEDHGKFRSGTIWLSNDSDRIPLRAEVEIFVGYVFAELVSIKFDAPPR